MKWKKAMAALLVVCMVFTGVGMIPALGVENTSDNQNVTSSEAENPTGDSSDTSLSDTAEDIGEPEDQQDFSPVIKDTAEKGTVTVNSLPEQAEAAKRATKAPAANSLDTVYVSAAGSDTDGQGTEESPVATLSKAIEFAKNGGTVRLLSNIDAKSLTFIDSKEVTVNGNGFSIIRAEGFSRGQDLARGGYNPAMIEVANGASLKLENIILDDAFRQEEDSYLEQPTGEGDKQNEKKAQDAIIAAYHGGGTITLGNGAILKNFGGMSAIRIGGQGESDGGSSKLIMEAGSRITDDVYGNRKGGAGAIWNQGGIIEMKAGSSIDGIDGRAMFLEDGSVANVAGNISNITANRYMTFDPSKGTGLGGGATGDGFAGIVAAVRGNSTFDLKAGGTVSKIISDEEKGSDVAFMLEGSRLTTESGSKISDISTIGVVDNNGGKINIDGIVSDCETKNVLFRLRGTENTFILGENGKIENVNTSDAGIVYLNGGRPTIEISGIIQNVSVGRSSWAVVFISRNGSREDGSFTLTSTGRITDVTRGEAIKAADPSRIVIDGEITNCSDYALSYETWKNSSVEIGQNATIYSTKGINVTKNETANDEKQHVVLKEGANITDPIKLVACEVILDVDYSTVKLGNASEDAANAIKTSVEEQHPEWKFVSSNAMWFQPSESTIHFTASKSSLDVKKTGLFAAYVPVDKDGKPVENAEVVTARVSADDKLDINLEGLTTGQSYALMLVNNTEYVFNPDDITVYTGGGQGDENYDNGFPEITLTNCVDISMKFDWETMTFTYDLTSLEVKGKEYTATPEASLLDQLIGLLEVSYTDAEGKPVEDDAVAGEYTAKLSWKDDLKDEDVKVNGNEVKLGEGGSVIVRHIDDIDGAQNGNITHELLTEEPTQPVTHAEAIAKYGNQGSAPEFYTNNDEDREADAEGVQLLDDGLLLEEDDNRQELMEQKAAEYLGAPEEGRAYRYDFHYLDLVDAFNGNAWVSAQYGTTVYLPYPEGVTKDNYKELDVKVLHYKDLHREYGISGQADVEEAIKACDLETMEEGVEFTENGIKFDVRREGFSPFAVVWKTEAHTITASAGEGGTIDPAGEVVVAEGTDQTFTITPDKGYEIAEVIVDGQAVDLTDVVNEDGTGTYTFEKIDGDHSISITFEAISVTPDPGEDEPNNPADNPNTPSSDDQQGNSGDNQQDNSDKVQSDDSTKTGDETPIALLAILLIASGTALVAVRRRR